MDNKLSNNFNSLTINNSNDNNSNDNNSDDNNNKRIIKINDTEPILFIDMSYYIFYRFFALCSWWKRAFPEEPLNIENILEVPRDEYNGMSACPFAKKERENDNLYIDVIDELSEMIPELNTPDIAN